MRHHIYAAISLSVFRDHIKSRKSMRKSQKHRMEVCRKKERGHYAQHDVTGERKIKAIGVCVCVLSDVGKEATTKH